MVNLGGILRISVLTAMVDVGGHGLFWGVLMRQINDLGIRTMKTLHKFSPTPYLTGDKVWAIGYGHTRTVVSNMEITEQEAEYLMRSDIHKYAEAVEKNIKIAVNDNQFAALTIFCAHIGIKNFLKTKMLRLLNLGWYEQVPAQLMRWGKDKPFLHQKRRKAEADLWRMQIEDERMTA